MGRMEKKMETTLQGLGFRVWGFNNNTYKSTSPLKTEVSTGALRVQSLNPCHGLNRGSAFRNWGSGFRAVRAPLNQKDIKMQQSASKNALSTLAERV